MQLPIADWREPKQPTRMQPGNLDALQRLVDTGQRYGCIYADPPWRYDNTVTRGAAAKQYETLTLQQIRELPVAQLALSKAHLHLWITKDFLPAGLEVVQAWGFEYKGLLTWCKPMGVGNYWRNSTEHLLLGVRGKLRFQHRGLKNWLYTPRGRHSRKPEAVRLLIEKASPAPRLELFGREAVEGWAVWGNQIEPTLWYPGREA